MVGVRLRLMVLKRLVFLVVLRLSSRLLLVVRVRFSVLRLMFMIWLVCSGCSCVS